MKGLTLFLCLGFMAALLSCTKEPNPLPSDSGREVELTVRADMGQTRATEADFNDEVESMQVFVFSGGRLEAVGYSTASESVTLRCFEGTKNIYAVVNHPEIEWTPDMADEDLLETVVELKDNLNVMFGYSTSKSLPSDRVLGDTPSYNMTLSVRRVAARIVLRSVKNSSSDTLTVTRAYITNVVGDADFYAVRSSSDYERKPEVWYNKMGVERTHNNDSVSSDLEGIFCSEEKPVKIWKQLKENFDEYFYCYPNPTASDYKIFYGEDGWCPRYTRLVVKAEYKGESYYYVVSIGGIQSNHSYEVELEIKGVGAVDEEGTPASEDDGGGNGDGDGDVGGNLGGGHFKDGDETGGGGGKGENSVSVRSCDGTAVIRFVGGRAEVREL